MAKVHRSRQRRHWARLRTTATRLRVNYGLASTMQSTDSYRNTQTVRTFSSARERLGALESKLSSGIRETIITDDAYTDLLAVRSALDLPTAGTWIPDESGQGGRLVPVTEAAQAARQQAIADVLEVAGACTRE